MFFGVPSYGTLVSRHHRDHTPNVNRELKDDRSGLRIRTVASSLSTIGEMIPSSTVSGFRSGDHNKDDGVAVQFDRDGQWYRTFHTLTHSFHRSLGEYGGRKAQWHPQARVLGPRPSGYGPTSSSCTGSSSSSLQWRTTTRKHQHVHPGPGPLRIDASKAYLEKLLPEKIDRKPRSGRSTNCKPIFGHQPKPVNFFQDGSWLTLPQGLRLGTLRHRPSNAGSSSRDPPRVRK